MEQLAKMSRKRELEGEIGEKKDCTWNEWKYGDCSVSCGGGFRTDKREMKSEAEFGGYCDLTGNSRKVECNTQDCPRTQFLFQDFSIMHILYVVIIIVLTNLDSCLIFMQIV